jgi:hypothetical protein
MRHYTLVFMEQRIGIAHLSPVEGDFGRTSFAALDDEAALVHINEHWLDALRLCVRAELSSMRIASGGQAGSDLKLLDDSHSNPNVQDSYVIYNTTTKTADIDFESTRTALLQDVPVFRKAGSRYGV